MTKDDRSIDTRVARRFPDHRVDLSFPICLPIYELRVRVTVLAAHKLSTAARYVLQLVDLGVSTPAAIIQHLGLPDALVPRVASELLGLELIEQAADGHLEMTGQGSVVLANSGASMRPQNRHPRLPYDPLTRRVAHVNVDELRERSVVRGEGLYVVPTRPRRPRPSDISFDEVRRYCAEYGVLREGNELLGIVDIKDVRLKYRTDVRLVRLIGHHTSKALYAAYRDTHYLEDESAGLQRLADKGVSLVPAEFDRADSSVTLGRTSVSKEEAQLLKAIKNADRDILQKDSVKEKQGPVGLEELRERLRTETGGQFGLVRTEEHRALLLRAIREARRQLTLVSAWINPRAHYEEVATMICDAISRGTRVRIAWGLGTTRAAENDRNRISGRAALKRLEDLIPNAYRSRLIEKRTETHEKYIICDSSFCAFGSFNWLSYRGERDEGYRREVSYYTERKEDIRLFEKLSEQLF